MRERLRALGRRLLGERPLPLVDRLARGDARFSTFVCAAEYVNFEAVPGDVAEFGVFGGVSLALIAKALSFDPKGQQRKVVGFDSFEGLPASEEAHARWAPGDCAALHSAHPLAPTGSPVTPGLVRDLFARCGLPEPALEVGRFDATLPSAVPGRYPRLALVHVDCDLYESTRDVLEGIAPALQDGTLLLFDDWFHYKGRPDRGEARAFHEFLERHPEWGAAHYRSYATFCNAFIVHRR